MFCCNLCGVWLLPTTSGLCNVCHKISRLVKVSSPDKCLVILQDNIIIKNEKVEKIEKIK